MEARRGRAFYGWAYINRKPFGEFSIGFSIYSKNGMTSVEVQNWDFPSLRWAQTCVDFKHAVERVKQRFNEIDEMVKDIPQSVQKTAKDTAKKEYLRLISTAVGIATLEKNRQRREVNEYTK